MSLLTEGQSCQLCHSYLFGDDDIVYCPACGAPHHRDCYAKIGHCALEGLHGTPQEYDSSVHEPEEKEPPDDIPKAEPIEDASVCPACRESYDPSLGACPKCGAPGKIGPISPFAGFDFLGGIAPEADLGQGVTADEARRFVVTNTPRYIPKFATMNEKNKTSWNWMAFFFPSSWLLGRKMYKKGLVAGTLWLAASLLSLPLQMAMNNGPVSQASTYTEYANEQLTLLQGISPSIIIIALAGFTFTMVIRVVCALYGDYSYKQHTIASVCKIKSEDEEPEAALHKKGGLNLWVFMLSFILLDYFLIDLISAFF